MSARDSLISFVETCRDIGRGALEEATYWPPSEPARVVYTESALDIFDRQMDNILGYVRGAQEEAE